MIIVETLKCGKVTELFSGEYRDALQRMMDLTDEREGDGVMLVCENSHSNEFADRDGWHSVLILADGWVTKVSH